ncbi:MAG: hypothetical protein FWD83_03835 [Promicromonosporaceae bacterium]|nr:hypothetical protein [Promicromonosporaceae bacterium]
MGRAARIATLGRARKGVKIITAFTMMAVGLTAGVLVAHAMQSKHNLVVTHTQWAGGGDANPGDGICANSAGQCTLRAAIHEANALNGRPGEVLITVDPSIAPGTPMTGTQNDNGNRMLTTQVTFEDRAGAMFHITAPMTIDLDDRLVPYAGGNDNNEMTLFYVEASGVELLNIHQPLTSGSSFVLAPSANNVLIDGAANGTRSTARTENWNPERFVVFREGSSNITVRGYDLSGFHTSQSEGGLFVFNGYTAGSASQPIRNILIDDIDVVNPAGTGGDCSGSRADGCRARFTNFVGGSYTDANRVHVHDLTFHNVSVQGMNSNSWGNVSSVLDFNAGWNGGSTSSNAPLIYNLTITDSIFANNVGLPELHRAIIALPPTGRLTGTTIIERNLFSTTTEARTAINVPGTNPVQGANSTFASQIYIRDNHFDGFSRGGGVVHLWQTGTATVQRNTFSRGGGQANTVNEESAALTALQGMVRNRNSTANQEIRTWYPTGTATVLAGPAPADAMAATPNEVLSHLSTCQVLVEATRPTAGTVPGRPVTLDVYWTAANRAEFYLGSAEGIVGDNAQIIVDLPIGTVDLPTAGLPDWMPNPPSTQAVITNQNTGAVNGFIRLQTHVELEQLQSSQYSRVVPITGSCSPQLTINQAESQLDPTSVRFLYYTVTSSLPINPDTFTPEDVTLTATPTELTIDADRINPRVISVTERDDAHLMVFDVVVAVDDSALVTAAIPAGAVASPGGITNLGPATSTDATIEFRNPLRATPGKFSVVTGDAKGYNYQLAILPGAPLPLSPLVFTTTVQQVQGAPFLRVSNAEPIIAAGDTWSPPITITADAGNVIAGTKALVHHTLRSADALYNGLVVPSLEIHLFSTDPRIRIVRSAFIDVGNPTDAEAIMATGTLVSSGARLLYRQPICFVWTVSNISADDWASALLNIEVIDTDLRLGTDGVIGHIDVLEIGESRHFAECTVLLPGDTRIEMLTEP